MTMIVIVMENVVIPNDDSYFEFNEIWVKNMKNDKVLSFIKEI